MTNYFDFILQSPGLNHIGVQIFKQLDLQALAECAEVSQQFHQFIKENISITDHENVSLRIACTNGNVKIVKLLLDQGFDVNIRNNLGETPLQCACKNGHDQVVALLCQQPSIDVNVRNYLHETPLHCACINGKAKVVKLLLEVNADVNIRDYFGQTPLHKACEKGQEEIVALLCQQPSADVNIQEDRLKKGYTPLHFACENGRLDIVKVLLKHPLINIHVKDKVGQTPMEKASNNGFHYIVDYIVMKKR